MGAQKTRQLEHVDRLGAYDLGEACVGVDDTLVRLPLQTLGLDVIPHMLDHIAAPHLFGADNGGELLGEVEGSCDALGLLLLFGGRFLFGRLSSFPAARLLHIGGADMAGVLFGELVELVDDNVALGKGGAGVERLPKTGFARDHFAGTVDRGACRHIFVGYGDLPLARDVDNPFALREAEAPEEGAKTAPAHFHLRLANGTGLLPVEVVGVIFFVEIERFERSGVVAIGVALAAVEIARFVPHFLQSPFVAFRALDLGEHFGHKRLFLSNFEGRGKFGPEIADQGAPIFVVFGDQFEVVLHRRGEADVHDLRKMVLEHLRDHLAKFGRF